MLNLQEFRLSAIPDRLACFNVQWIDGSDAVELLTEDAIAKVQKVTSYLTKPAQEILKRYEFADAGGWYATGTTLDGDRAEVPYFKPLTPRQSSEPRGFGRAPKVKIVKYETPKGMEAAPLLPWVDPETAQIIFDRYYAKPEAGETFWQTVKRCNIPIALTEGLKKALALIAFGIPAIACRGIYNWRIKGTNELHPTIADFATSGRKVFIAFDKDEKATTQKDVRTQTLKLGEALALEGTKPHIALWNSATGKGVDDALYAMGQGAQAWLNSVLDDAPDFKTYKRDSRVTKALESIKRLNTLTYAVERATTGDYLPELPKLSQGTIAVLDASMNAGKTTRIGQDYVKPWIDRGGHVLVVTPINNLGQQAASDWDLPHIHDYATDRDSQSALWSLASHQGGVVMCGESLHRIPEWFWTKPVLLILDEANQIVDGLNEGDTLGSRYSLILEKLTAAARHSIGTGAIVLSEDGIPDRAVKFMQDISDGQAVLVFTHRKMDPWKVELYRGQASGYRARFLQAAASERLLYVASSQREGERIERAMRKRYPDRKVIRIDSKTNQSGQFTDFFKKPDQWIQDNQPDVLILSPSAKSGVSIEGGVSPENAYFSAVWGYFSVLTTDTHMQLLGRYRPAVPRVVFCPDFILSSGDESLLNPRAIKRRLGRTAKTIAGVYGLGEWLETSDETAELRGTIETAVMNYRAAARAVSGNQKLIAHLALADRLKKAGHNVTTVYAEKNQVMVKQWKEINEEIWREEAAAIAAAAIDSRHDLEWARKALDGLETSLETRVLAQKVIWRSEFPGVAFDCPDECYVSLTRDYGAMARGVKLQAKAENLDGARLDDAALTKDILLGNIRALHRLPRSQVQAVLVSQSGVLELLDGTIYTNADQRCQNVKAWALRSVDEISYWLRLQINKTQTPIEICHKLLRKLGIERDKADRPGAIKFVDRKGKRGQNSERYQVDLNYCPIRARLLEAARRRLSESVTSICNKDKQPIQITVTLPSDTFPDPIATQISEGDGGYYEYIPTDEELAQWEFEVSA